MGSPASRSVERTLAIDARKITHSGIGRYLRNLLPLVLPSVQADRILLIGREDELSPALALDPRCRLLHSNAAPHSPAEQALAFHPQLRRAPLLWVPHYNIPLLRTGAIVSTIHDLAPLDLPESLGSTSARLAARVLLPLCARRSAAILTPSHFSKGRIVSRLGVPPERVTVTPLAVDPSWPEGDDPAPNSPTADYLLFVGNLKPNKNLRGLLAALRLLDATGTPPLLVAGRVDGFRSADQPALQEAAAFGDRVRFLGAVPDNELIDLYRGAAALVLPSLYEGFGLPVLEAMRYGCPVVTSRGTSLPEVAGEAALLVDPRDPAAIAAAIRQALHPAERERLRQAGFARERQFRYMAAAERTASTLNRFLEEQPCAAHAPSG